MPVSALALVLLAALLHAIWNYHLKRAASDRTFWLLAYAISACVSLPAIWCFAPESLSQITAKGWLLIALSAPIHVGYALMLQAGYRHADYSVVYPTARGTGPLITVMAAVLVLGNAPSPAGWAGIACIIAGIVLITMKPEDGAEKKRIRAGLLWGMATGCFIAGYSFCDAWAMQQETGLTPYTFYFPSLAVRTVLLAPFVMMTPGWKKEAKRLLTEPVARRCLAVVTLGSPGAYVLVLFALTMAPLAYVAPAREVGMMVGVVLGAVLLKEKLAVGRVAGVAAMVAGVILIGVGG